MFGVLSVENRFYMRILPPSAEMLSVREHPPPHTTAEHIFGLFAFAQKPQIIALILIYFGCTKESVVITQCKINL